MKRLLFILFCLIMMMGCELFTPRDSEPPIDNADPYAWMPPTTPESVLENLSNAFPANKQNYHLDVLQRSVDDLSVFRFFPDHGVASSQPGVFENWSYEEEENFIIKLFQLLDPEGLQRLEWEVDQLSPIEDKYEIIADYELTLSYGENQTSFPNHFSGQATLTLVQNTDLLYEVALWQDIASDSLPCWSDLKALVQ